MFGFMCADYVYPYSIRLNIHQIHIYASVETSVYCMHNLDWCVCVECMGPAGGPYGLLTGHCVVSCAPVVSV